MYKIPSYYVRDNVKKAGSKYQYWRIAWCSSVSLIAHKRSNQCKHKIHLDPNRPQCLGEETEGVFSMEGFFFSFYWFARLITQFLPPPSTPRKKNQSENKSTNKEKKNSIHVQWKVYARVFNAVTFWLRTILLITCFLRLTFMKMKFIQIYT